MNGGDRGNRTWRHGETEKNIMQIFRINERKEANKMKAGVLGFVAVVMGCLSAVAAHDATNDWNVATGDAVESANFNPATAPGATGLVRVGNGGTLSVTSDLAWGALWVGTTAKDGAVEQTAGTLMLSEPGTASGDGTLRLGDATGRFGAYRLTEGTLDVTKGNPQIGVNGDGLLAVEGGTFRTVGYPSVGRYATAYGQLLQTGGFVDLSSASQLTVGEGGVGTLTLAGGAAQVKKMVVGAGEKGRGLVNLCAGSSLSVGMVSGGKATDTRFNAVGGTLKPQSSAESVPDWFAGVPVTVGAGGLVVDTDGKTATLAASLSASRLMAANLAHRWSFNGNLADSVGAQDATAAGAQADKISFVDGEVRLPGLGKGQATLALGAGIVPAGLDGVTVELWATPEETRSWSRVFTAASTDGAQTLYLAWANDQNVEKGAFCLKANGETLWSNTSDFAPLALSRKWHFAFVFAKADAGWTVTALKQDPRTGFRVQSETKTIAASDWDPASLFSGSFNLGYSANDADACARYDEVRVWKVALTESELLESATRGPDADFATPPVLCKTGDGTLALSTAATYAGATEVTAGAVALSAPETPVHRWHETIDLPGGAHGTAYKSLGKGVLPTTEAGFTIELWATLRAARNWSRLFTFSDDDNANGFFMTWVNGTDNTRDMIGLRQQKTTTTVGAKMAPYELDTPYHVVVVCAKVEGAWKFRFYKQNVRTGDLEKTYEMVTPDGWTPSLLAACAFNLGWSTDNGNDDAEARYDEIRIWNRAFSETDVLASGRAGADRLPFFEQADAARGALPEATDLVVADGAAFALGGASQTVASLSGAGAVYGAGTLTATAGIFPGGKGEVGVLTLGADATLVGTVALDVSAEGASDALAFEAGGTYDVSGLRLTVADPAKLDKAKRYVVLRTSGATLCSEPDVSALPKNWELRFRDNIGQIVYRHGLTILLQ